jgi:hypothetical protein
MIFLAILEYVVEKPNNCDKKNNLSFHNVYYTVGHG